MASHALLRAGAWAHLDLQQGQAGAEEPQGQAVPPGSRISACRHEFTAPWQSLKCLTPDATQLHEAGWQPEVRAAGGLSIVACLHASQLLAGFACFTATHCTYGARCSSV